ncbi:putative RNA pseudouridine synthase YhcT [Chlamydiales bacterium STE3]|nr:putative RNA pseudouridine synthase YhcT [Chlamydiales bacterium STE3]
MKTKVIEKQNLLETLAILAPDSTKTTLRSWIKQGRVSINGKVCLRADQEVLPKQEVSVAAKQWVLGGKIKILYQDTHIIVIDKPTGVLSVSSNFEKKETAHGYLKEHFSPSRVHVVHRLDQDTSGVMLFAFSEKAKENLKKMFEKHELERSYIALVEEEITSEKGTWQSYLFEDGNYVVRTTQNPEKGKLAVTHYEVLNVKKNVSSLRLTLETGRKNQIRVHCKEAGHPVVGDKKYGAQTNLLRRVCLHAHYLSFKHPITNKVMTFTSPVPKEFNKYL